MSRGKDGDGATNTGLATANPAAWRVADAPRVTIGVAIGAPEYELFRPSSPRRLPNGNTIVLDGSGELRTYDSDGTFLRRTGRRGAGPGEFSGLGAICRFAGDSLAVIDLEQRRATVLDAQGAVTRGFRLQGEGVGSVISPVGCTSAGILIGWTGATWATGAGGFSQDSIILVAFDTQGALIYRSDPYPGPYRYSTSQGGRLVVNAVPVSHQTRFAVGGRHLVVADGARYRMTKFELREDPAAARPGLELIPIASYESRQMPPALTSQAIDRLIDDNVERFPAGALKAARERVLRELPWPDRLRAVDRLLFDRLGYVWLRRPTTADDAMNPWLVLDDSLAVIATVITPPELMVSEIGEDYVLGFVTDSEGTPIIVAYDLFREP